MKICLFNAGIEPEKYLSHVGAVMEGLVGDELQAKIRKGIIDNDLFISDTQLLKGESIVVMFANGHHITSAIKSGGVLLCFAGKANSISGGRDNYSWIPSFSDLYAPENLEASVVKFYGSQPFIKALQDIRDDFEFECIFNNKTRSSAFEEIGKDKGGRCIALYINYGNGHIFILPRPKNKEKFIEYFIGKILPTLNLTFETSIGSKEPIPEEIKKLLVVGQDTLRNKIQQQRKEIKQEKDKLSELYTKYEDLEKWKDLLWQTGDPLEDIVKEFFGLLGLKLKKQEIDLVGEYDGNEVFIEVKGNIKCIDHKSDFRQTLQRKLIDSKDPEKTIAMLVGNPFRLHPLEKRPPSNNHSLFTEPSVKIAKSNEIGLIPTMELYDALNHILDPRKKVNKNKILKQILFSYGLYSYSASSRIKKKEGEKEDK